MRFEWNLKDHDPNGKTVTSLLRFNTNQSYSESMSGGKGAAAVTLLLKRILNFPGENQSLVPKVECHHHHRGNRTLIFHLPSLLDFRCFLAFPRSQSVRGWPVRPAKFLSDKGIKGEFQLLPLLFPVWQNADALRNKCLRPVPHLLYALHCHL